MCRAARGTLTSKLLNLDCHRILTIRRLYEVDLDVLILISKKKNGGLTRMDGGISNTLTISRSWCVISEASQ